MQQICCQLCLSVPKCQPVPHPPVLSFPLVLPPPPRSYADSKTLTESERSRLFKALAADTNCCYAADLLSAVSISSQMLGRHKVSLNAIAEGSTIGLIQAMLDAGVNLTEVGVREGRGGPDRQRLLKCGWRWLIKGVGNRLRSRSHSPLSAPARLTLTRQVTHHSPL